MLRQSRTPTLSRRIWLLLLLLRLTMTKSWETMNSILPRSSGMTMMDYWTTMISLEVLWMIHRCFHNNQALLEHLTRRALCSIPSNNQRSAHQAPHS
jgi:hypothetical protein